MPAIDDFAGYSPGSTGSSERVFAITPHATNELPYVTRAIRASTGGTVRFVNRYDETCDAAFADGETRAIRAKRVLATGTTATGLEGMA